MLNSFSAFTISLSLSSIILNFYYRNKYKVKSEYLEESTKKSVLFEEERTFNNLIKHTEENTKPKLVGKDVDEKKVKTQSKINKKISLSDIQGNNQ